MSFGLALRGGGDLSQRRTQDVANASRGSGLDYSQSLSTEGWDGL